MLAVSLGLCFLLTRLDDDPGSLVQYLVYIVAFGFVVSGPEVRIIIEERQIRSSSKYDCYLIGLINRIMALFAGAFLQLIYGVLLERNIHLMFVYLMVLVGICLATITTRFCLFPDELRICS